MDEKPDSELQEDIAEIESTEKVEEQVEPVEVPESAKVEEPAPVEVPESAKVEEPVQVEPPKQKSELPKKLIGQPKRIGAALPKALDRLKSFWIECKRVLRVTKKPDKEEFVMIVKISAIGMGVVGVIGFIIHFAKELLF